MRNLCDKPEYGGYGMSVDQVANMTFWQLNLFSTDKKALGGSVQGKLNFREARAILLERKKNGK